MLYPYKFQPIYKSTLWGGRNLQKFGRVLPEGKVSESWEISGHPDGESRVSNGVCRGMSLMELIREFGSGVMGNELSQIDREHFPLLIKLIDANDKLSIQVHPNDTYASTQENGARGKTEMWYIIDAKPGATIVFDVNPGTTRESFACDVQNGQVSRNLKSVEVFSGDVIYLPSGVVHAIGAGIMLAEIQQGSNLTYRVYDYDRVDYGGNLRQLHIEKAMKVIDFHPESRKEKYKGLVLSREGDSKRTLLVANKYFATELYQINGQVYEHADGRKFHIYINLEGEGEILSSSFPVRFGPGESILIPACMGRYAIAGKCKMLKTYLPNMDRDILDPLKEAGYSSEEISTVIGIL